MGLWHSVTTHARAAREARRRRSASPPAPSREAFRERFAELLRRAPEALVRDHAFFELPANRPPWLATPWTLAKDEAVTTIAAGRVEVSRLFDVWVGPSFQLWMRVGEAGPIFRGTRSTHSFRTAEAGRLYLASYFPGEWADPSGRLGTPERDYRRMRGGLTVLAVRWSGDPAPGLRSWLERVGEDPLLRSELERLERPPRVPEGWSYLWRLGPAEIFTPDDSGAGIQCHTHGDVGILQRAAPLPFRPGTRLRWSWKLDSLPSTLAEDTIPTHDYISVAVEFENGQDLTYHWSAELPPETGYRCPLPTWKARETHVVVRSGREELGRFLDEERDLYADYARFVGPPPERIVRLWLIANSLFQRGHGRAELRRIELAQDGEARRVL